MTIIANYKAVRMVSASARALSPREAVRRVPGISSGAQAAAWRLLCAFAFFIPFSIFLAQLLLILATAAAVVDWWQRGRPRASTVLDPPIVAFLAAGLVGALFGLNPVESLWGLRTYLQIVIAYLVYAYARDLERAEALVHCFLAGAAVTAGYRVLGTLFPDHFPRLFLGQMTQSGQLLFAISLVLPLLLLRVSPPRPLWAALLLYGIALVANLKRGVWLGVLASIVMVGSLASRRLLAIAALVVAITAAAVPSARERVANSARDLFLPGNRYDIWVAAIDVVHRFPMGVGRKNGEILRDYPNIPQHHKHAHNNLLQVTLESGYLGLATFLWWMVSFGVLCARALSRIPASQARWRALAIGVTASFVGFHVAGLVEYNFGDSEVLEVFFVAMGLGLILHDHGRHGE
jgi:O-antigen ligase